MIEKTDVSDEGSLVWNQLLYGSNYFISVREALYLVFAAIIVDKSFNRKDHHEKESFSKPSSQFN